MKFKNKIFNMIEKLFDPDSKYHNNLNDLMIKYEASKTKTISKNLNVPGPTFSKIIENDITKPDTILNEHYVYYAPLYQIIDSNVFTISFLKYLEPGVEITDSFIKKIIDEKIDYHLKITHTPKDSSISSLRNALEIIRMREATLEEELKRKKNDPVIEKQIEKLEETKELVESHLGALQNSTFSNLLKVDLGFKLMHPSGDVRNIKNTVLSFASKIRQFGHAIDLSYNRQQFMMFDYVNGTKKPTYNYYVSADNVAIGALQPFIYANFVEANAPIIGNYDSNKIPLTLDFWDLPNQNGVIIGISGSGKSATSKVITTRNLIIANRKIIIIDPQREYLYTAKAVGGEYIDILASARNENMSINIFDKASYETDESNSFDLKINDIITFFSFASASTNIIENGTVISKPLESNPIYYQFTSKLIKSFYKKFNIFSLEDINENTAPTLNDFIEYVNTLKNDIEKNNIINLDPSITSDDINYQNYLDAFKLISNACETLLGNEYAIFRGKTKINLNNKYIVFNTKGLSPKMDLLTTYVIMNYVVKTMSSDIAEQKILLIDEGWKLLSQLGSDYIKIIAKTARKFNLGLIITTQQLSDLDNEQGMALLENSSFIYIFKQKEIERNKEKLTINFGLTDEDLDFLKNASPGKGILKFGDEKYRIDFIITPSEMKFAESNVTKLKTLIPDEIIRVKKEIERLSITIDYKRKLSLNTSYEEKLLDYNRALLDSLIDIKERLKSEAGQLEINEDNIENFVLDDKKIYSLNVKGEGLFDSGVGIDEIKYLIKEGYKEYTIKNELTKVFGNEIFYIKTRIVPEEIFIYSKYLDALIKKNYSKYIIGDPYIEHDTIVLQVKTPKISGKFYVYNPKTDSAEIFEAKNGEIIISKSPQLYDYFKDQTINENYIYVYDMNEQKSMVFLESQFKLSYDKILYDTKRVYIRISYNYFLPFSKEEISFSENSEFYYMILTDSLYNSFVGPGGAVPKEYFKYDQAKEMLQTIFGR
jgi:hypothetical protein